jgi:hypothetical protein
MTSSGIKPMTFQLVAQCFNQLRYHMLWWKMFSSYIHIDICARNASTAQLYLYLLLCVWMAKACVENLSIRIVLPSLHTDSMWCIPVVH